MKIGKCLILFFCFFLTHCDENEFQEFFELGPFRVLAIEADQPEIAASDAVTQVTLTPYVSDIDAGGRVISTVVRACPDPGIAFGAEPTCVGSSQLNPNLPGYADVNTGSLGTTFTGALPSIAIPVPGGLLNGLSSLEQQRGIDYIVTFDFTAGETTVLTFKRIRISTNTPNQNPQVGSIAIDGNAGATSLSDQNAINLVVSSNTPPEEYVFVDFGGNVSTETEEYLTTWFTFGGTTESARTDFQNTTLWSDGIEEPKAFKLLASVLRDKRGGTNVFIQTY